MRFEVTRKVGDYLQERNNTKTEDKRARAGARTTILLTLEDSFLKMFNSRKLIVNSLNVVNNTLKFIEMILKSEITLKFQSSIVSDVFLKKENDDFFFKSSCFPKNEIATGSCSTSDPSGIQVDGLPLVAMSGLWTLAGSCFSRRYGHHFHNLF